MIITIISLLLKRDVNLREKSAKNLTQKICAGYV